MEKARLSILVARIKSQVESIEKLFAKVEERKEPKSSAEWESLAFRLHNLYCGFEDLFKIVAEAFENQIEAKSRYHAELLKRMAIEIEGIRPALLSPETVRLLDNLRSFRHFFRWAYATELDERKLRLVLEDALMLKDKYRRDIELFIQKLKSSVNEENPA
ncbi:hypothetical protein [Desulfothermobacter acidiphilus]|uniref:ribonuclease toxin HepT-like protein n=1 Tax=Desulfothermobacter acidiphilus TaxID=1938353 RepID=UPI003F8B34FA